MTDKILEIDEIKESERSKKLEGLYNQMAFQNLADYSINPSINLNKRSSSSIASLSENNKSPSQDVFEIKTNSNNNLKNPKINKAFQQQVAEAISRNEDIIYDIAKIIIKNIDQEKKVLKEISIEDQEIIKKRLSLLAKKENIDTYKNILLTITAASSIVIGSMIIAPGAITHILATESAKTAATLAASKTAPIWGYLLVASGISSILNNNVLPKTSFFEKISSFFTSNEKKAKTIENNLRSAVNLATSVTSIVSSIATSNFLSSILEWGTSFEVLKVGSTIAGGSVSYLSQKHQSNISYLHSDQTRLKGTEKFHNFLFDKNTDDLNNISELNETFNKIAFNIIQTLTRISDQNIK
jgi:hypothetical protein